MKAETAQRMLWFAIIFIVLFIIATIGAGVGFVLAVEFLDLGSFITDPTVLTFIQAYPLFIPAIIFAIAGLEIIYLIIIYMWRKDPMAHRTGFTIVGILNLLMGFSLPGLFIILPGLLLEPQ
ncbi:MAG: hypothetical protein AM325_002220 [Candidatus Thorarchaeota archaeon SMTZ1-45]|nr:MAG: hypothetical protein AM325_04025 [Candidatus Thorarchaeota archaeon SMTZ1-45]